MWCILYCKRKVIFKVLIITNVEKMMRNSKIFPLIFASLKFINQTIIQIKLNYQNLFMKRHSFFLLIMLLTAAFNTACSEDTVTTETIEAAAATNTVTASKDTTSNNTKTNDENVIFQDDFNQTSSIPDQTKWVLCPTLPGVAWGNYLSKSYDQAYVSNGVLVVKGEKVNGTYKAGGIQTYGKFSFTYGKIEVRARFKTAQGGWPAIWLMPDDMSAGWPSCGEIDIMEQVSYETDVHQTVHTHYANDLGKIDPIRSVTKPFNTGQFNTYGVNWTPEMVQFTINGQVTLSYPNMHLSDEASMKQWPFNKNFYVILNFALGGAGTWPGTITDSDLPGYMEVDWVKVTRN